MSPLYHRLEVYVVDFEKYGIENVKAEIGNLDGFYRVADHQTTTIPNWTDDHELNKSKCTLETRRKYFDIKQVGTFVDVPLRDKTKLEKENEKLKEENELLKRKLADIKRCVEKV